VVRKVFRLWLFFVLGYALVIGVSFFKPLEFLGVAVLPLYLFPLFLGGILHLPGFVTTNPAGWGWGSPTFLGWFLAGLLLILILWLLAYVIIFWTKWFDTLHSP
jgi:hypothetical protein